MGSKDKRRRATAAGSAVGVVLAAAAVSGVGAGAEAAPPYSRTIGQPGHAALHAGGIDVDDSGNIYVADTGNDTIVKYPAGSTTPEWVVGKRGAPIAQGSFADPRDIAVSSTRIYVADNANGLVQVLDLDGKHVGQLGTRWGSVMGVTMGVAANGQERIVVSEGKTGEVHLFNSAHQRVLVIPPRSGPRDGTRDAATDSQGNVYVANYRNNKIDKYSPTGTYLMSWGGTAQACQKIPKPYGVAVDASDRVYVAASNNNLVRSFTTTGQCVRSYGQNGTGPTQLSQLRRVAVSRSGADPRIYAADLWGLKVLLFNTNGTLASPLFRVGDGVKPEPGGLNEVMDAEVFDGHVYGVDMNNHRVTRWELDGSNPVAFGRKGRRANAAELNWPMGLGINPVDGGMWVADTHNSRVLGIGPNGTGPFRVIAGLNWPMDVTFDDDGNMYVADTKNSRVVSYTPALTVRWTRINVPQPRSLTFDAVNDRLLVAETGGSRITAVDLDTGELLRTMPIGQGGAAGQIQAPRGLALAPDGSFWVSSPGLNRVSRYTAGGAYTGDTVGGSRGTGVNQLSSPNGIAVGPGGGLYVADGWNDRIQVFEQP